MKDFYKVVTVILLALVIFVIVQPLAVLPGVLLFTGILMLDVAILGGLTGWISADTSNVALAEISFLIAFLFAFLAWAVAVFIWPLAKLAAGAAAPAAPPGAAAKPAFKEIFLKSFASFGGAYSLIGVFFWFIVGEYHWYGSFFEQHPPTLWNALASAMNILSDDHLAKYIKDTDVSLSFVACNNALLRNKLIVTLTQFIVALGVLKPIVAVLTASDGK